MRRLRLLGTCEGHGSITVPTPPIRKLLRCLLDDRDGRCLAATTQRHLHRRAVNTGVPGLAAGDKLVQLVYEALDAATQTETAHQEELAAKRALEKAHVKVSEHANRRCDPA